MTSAPPARSARRRRVGVITGILVGVGALAGLGEVGARALVPAIAEAQIQQALGIDGDGVAVQTEGILLPQLLTGRLGALDLTVDGARLGTLTADVSARAIGVPLGGGAFESLIGTVSIDAEQFSALLAPLALPVEEIALGDGVVIAGGTVRVLIVDLPLAASLAPEIVDGAVTLHPTEFEVGGMPLNAQELLSQLGSVGEALLGPHEICIADRLPAGLTITDIAVSPAGVMFGASADGAILVDPALRERGEC